MREREKSRMRLEVWSSKEGDMVLFIVIWMFPGGSDGKESACSAGDPGLIPGLGRSSGEGNGNPLWYSCLENSMDRGAPMGYSLWGYKEWDRLID